MTDCPNHLRLSQWLLAELAADEQRKTDAHLETCCTCRAKAEQMRENHALFAERAPRVLENLRTAIDRPVDRWPGHSWRWPLLASLSMALGIVAVLMVVPPDPPSNEVRYKGAVSLRVVVARGGNQFDAATDMALRPHDALRLVLTTSGAGQFGAVLVDAAQRKTLLYPNPDETPRVPLAIAGGGTHALPDSFVLDESVGRERLLWLFCDPSVPGSVLEAALMHGAPPQWPIDDSVASHCHHGILAWVKERR